MKESRFQNAVDARARRAAVRVGLVARKSRRSVDMVRNHGGFTLVDPSMNGVVAGSQYDMTAQEVIDYCRE